MYFRTGNISKTCQLSLAVASTTHAAPWTSPDPAAAARECLDQRCLQCFMQFPKSQWCKADAGLHIP